VPSNDVGALAEAIKRAVREGHTVTARAQTEVLGRFSKERLISDVESLYELLLEKNGVSGGGRLERKV
jgi:hypothetical protein